MRSWKRTRCGEVKTCTDFPAASSMARMNEIVEPLPLVPATWITGGRAFCGLPSRSSTCHMRSSDRSIFFGWSARKRAIIASEWSGTGFTLLPARPVS
jgi:hypothetical protein